MPRRLRVTPSAVEDEHKLVDIYDRGANPDVDTPINPRFYVTSRLHKDGRRYYTSDFGYDDNAAYDDDKVDLYRNFD